MHSIWVNLFDPGNEAIKFEPVYGYHIYPFGDRTWLLLLAHETSKWNL
jgi:hypothetical protein